MKTITGLIVSLIFIQIFTFSISAQTFQIGFGAELNITTMTPPMGTRVDSPFNFFVIIRLKEKKIVLLKDLITEVRFGTIISPDYLAGSYASFFLKSHILTNSIYLVCGINLHYNMGQSHNLSSVYVKEITLLNTGIGANLSDNVFIELSRSFPLSNSALGENDDTNFYGSIVKHIYKLRYLYNIDLGVVFNL